MVTDVLPDVELICEISKVLDTSLNSLLGIHTNTISESNNYKDKLWLWIPYYLNLLHFCLDRESKIYS